MAKKDLTPFEMNNKRSHLKRSPGEQRADQTIEGTLDVIEAFGGKPLAQLARDTTSFSERTFKLVYLTSFVGIVMTALPTFIAVMSGVLEWYLAILWCSQGFIFGIYILMMTSLFGKHSIKKIRGKKQPKWMKDRKSKSQVFIVVSAILLLIAFNAFMIYLAFIKV